MNTIVHVYNSLVLCWTGGGIKTIRIRSEFLYLATPGIDRLTSMPVNHTSVIGIMLISNETGSSAGSGPLGGDKKPGTYISACQSRKFLAYWWRLAAIKITQFVY